MALVFRMFRGWTGNRYTGDRWKTGGNTPQSVGSVSLQSPCFQCVCWMCGKQTGMEDEMEDEMEDRMKDGMEDERDEWEKEE